MNRDRGFDYTVALCSAIESTTAAIEGADRSAFRYRGARLTFATERALFVSMINDRELYSAFAEGRRESPAESSRSRVERAVAQRLLSDEPDRFASGRIAEKPRFTAARLADQLRRRPRHVPAPPESPVCFLIDHAKFLRFIEPVSRALDADVVLLSSAGDLGGVTLDYRDVAARLEARAIGAALREYAHLAGAYDLLRRTLAKIRPACLVVIEGNSPHDELANRACKDLGIPCVCLQQGWSPIVHTGFRNMSFTSMAVWGDGFRDLLAPQNPDQHFDVAGSPAFAIDARGDGSPPPGAGSRCVSFFFQDVSQLIDEEDLRQMMELVRMASERFTDDMMLVREHPGAPFPQADREALENAPNVVLVPPSSHSLKDVIEASRAAVAIYSTSLLEAAALGTPALAFNTTSLPRYLPDLAEHGVGVETSDPDVALDALDRLLHDDAHHASFRPATDRFGKQFFSGADAGAPERIKALIESVAAA
jgi:glycosyltransferase involved in cell wall biosynthesis